MSVRLFRNVYTYGKFEQFWIFVFDGVSGNLSAVKTLMIYSSGVVAKTCCRRKRFLSARLIQLVLAVTAGALKPTLCSCLNSEFLVCSQIEIEALDDRYYLHFNTKSILPSRILTYFNQKFEPVFFEVVKPILSTNMVTTQTIKEILK